MSTKLEKKFNRIEASRKKLFSELSSYSNEVLNKKPSAEAWSVAEVISHVLTAEEFSLKYIQKKSQDLANIPPSGFSGIWKTLLLKGIFMVPALKFKVPDVVKPAGSNFSVKELESKYEKNRHDTWTLINKWEHRDLQKAVWKHVRAGKMNIYEMLDFWEIHFNRHEKQIKRTLAAVK